jgi:hypothetical protein
MEKLVGVRSKPTCLTIFEYVKILTVAVIIGASIIRTTFPFNVL